MKHKPQITYNPNKMTEQLNINAVESLNSCSISARFRLFNGIVVVLANNDDMNDGLSKLTANGKPIQYVSLGSIQHFEAVSQRVSELTSLNRDPKLEKELELKRQELIFLRNNCEIRQNNIESDRFDLGKEETLGN
jgi:hypothetical protein